MGIPKTIFAARDLVDWKGRKIKRGTEGDLHGRCFSGPSSGLYCAKFYGHGWGLGNLKEGEDFVYEKPE